MWLTYAVGSAVLTAVFMTLTKWGMGEQVKPTVAMGIQAIISAGLAWTVVLLKGEQATLSGIPGKLWGVMAGAGVLAGTASLLLFQAINAGKASRVIPVDRLSFVFAAVLAYLFLEEKINLQVGAGLGLMAVGVVVIVLAPE